MGYQPRPSSGGGATWELKSADFTPSSGGQYLVDTAAGAVTITNPTGVAGGYYWLASFRRSWNTNPVILEVDGFAPAAFNGPQVFLMSYTGSTWTRTQVASDGSYVTGGGGSSNGQIDFVGGEIQAITQWTP